MKLHSKAIILIITTVFANNIFGQNLSSQDSIKVQDPQPVIITQDGYSPQTDIQNIPLSELTFKQRLKYGGSFGPFSFSNYQTVIGISPMLGYKLTEQTVVGVGASIIFWRQRVQYNAPKEKTDLVGFSAFLRQDLPFTQKLNFPLHIHIEATQFQGMQQNFDFKPALLGGLGMGNAGGYGLQVLWDFNYDMNGRSFSGSFSNSPLVIRATGFFN